MTTRVAGDPVDARRCATDLGSLSLRLLRTAEALRDQAGESPAALGGRTGEAYRRRCGRMAVSALRIAVRTDHLSRGLHCLADELAEARRLRRRGLADGDPELVARGERLEAAAQAEWIDCLGRLVEDPEDDAVQDEHLRW